MEINDLAVLYIAAAHPAGMGLQGAYNTLQR